MIASAHRLRATLGFLRPPPTEPELRLLHRALDNWSGVGLVLVGMYGVGGLERGVRVVT